MATMTERLAFVLTLDGKQAVRSLQDVGRTADKELGQAETAGSKLSAGFKKYGASAAAFAGVAGAALYSLANTAGDLSETVAASEVIFGSAAGTVADFGDAAAEAAGMSKRAAIEGANTFGTFGKSAGLAGEELAGFSTEMVQLAGDLASFKNTSPEEAITAIGAALRGESEPIRQYGVLLDDATLKARAMELGIYDGVGALTAQEKVLAAQAEILAQTSDAQGDFGRTSDSLANKQRTLAADFENLQAKLGQKLIPLFSDLVGALSSATNAVVGFFDEMGRGFQVIDRFENRIGTGFRRMAEGIGLVEPEIKVVVGAMVDAADAADGMAGGIESGGDAIRLIGDRLKGVNGQLDESATGFAGVDYAIKGADGKFRELDGTLVGMQTGFAGVDAGFEDMVSGSNDTTAATNELRRSVEKAERAQKTWNDEVFRSSGALFSAEQATMDADQAYQDYEQQLRETNTALADGTLKGNEAATALRDLRGAEIGAAEEAYQAAEAFARSSGAADGSAQKAALMRQKLAELQDKFPGLRDEIQQYINALNRIPSEKTTNIITRTSTVTVSGAPARNFVKPEERAVGGPVRAGEPYLVGENGPEVVVPAANGTVIPNGGSGGRTAAPTLGGPALVIQNMTVQNAAGVREALDRAAWLARVQQQRT